MTEQKKIYLSQKDLFDEIIKCRIEGRISEKLGVMFMTLSRKYANHRNFVRYYHIREDLVAIGAAACCKGFDKFRPYKDREMVWDEETPIKYDHNICNNAFAFFTTIARNDFIAFLKKEYNQSNITNEMRLESGLDASYGYEDFVAEREAKERAEKAADEENDINRISAISLDEQTVWDNITPSEDDDDSIIDWQEVSS